MASLELELYNACDKGDFETVKSLLQKPSLNINLLVHDRENALHVACRKGDIEIVALLLQHKDTNREIPNDEGHKPIDIASQNNYTEIVNLLSPSTFSYFSNSISSWYGNSRKAISIGQTLINNTKEIIIDTTTSIVTKSKVIPALLFDNKERNIFRKNIVINHNYHKRFFEMVCKYRAPQIKQLFLNKKEHEITRKQLHTLLELSCYEGEVELIKWLLSEQKTDVNFKATNGYWQLCLGYICMCAMHSKHYIELIKLLLSYGAIIEDNLYTLSIERNNIVNVINSINTPEQFSKHLDILRKTSLYVWCEGGYTHHLFLTAKVIKDENRYAQFNLLKILLQYGRKEDISKFNFYDELGKESPYYKNFFENMKHQKMAFSAVKNNKNLTEDDRIDLNICLREIIYEKEQYYTNNFKNKLLKARKEAKLSDVIFI